MGIYCKTHLQMPTQPTTDVNYNAAVPSGSLQPQTAKPKQFRFNSFEREYDLLKEVAAMFPYHYPNKTMSKWEEIATFISTKYKQSVTGISCQRVFHKMYDEFKVADKKKRWASGTAEDYSDYDQLLQECSDLYDAYLLSKAQNRENKDKELEKIKEDEAISQKMLSDATKSFKLKIETPKDENSSKKRKKGKSGAVSSYNSDIIDLTNLEALEKQKLDIEMEKIEIDRKRLKLEEERIQVDLKREQNKEKEMDLMKDIFNAYKSTK